MEAVIRKAVTGDIPEILQISTGVWDGNDYIPSVLDEWMADGHGEFVVADAGGHVAAFAKITLLTPHDAWLEGLRGSKEFKGMGFAQQITRYFIDRARKMDLRSLRLSTYQDNHESRHIIEKYGFREIARLVFIGREVQPGSPAGAVPVKAEDFAVLWQQAADSEWIRAAGGFLANSWRFVKLNEATLRQWIDRGSMWRFPTSGAVAAFFPDEHSCTDFELTVITGGPGDVASMVQHGQWLAQQAGRKYLYCQCPAEQPLLEAFFAAGCNHFDMTPPEVGYTLVLEYGLSQA